ncbi:YdbH domain-containing protein [Agarivorans sp. 1_MG-2023]|uniref:intermembrane phospholipid transport protein YdbH family protein n=1 Tax=Agarivorans sp. 1_MG-2023 TaxID=3062634 RepID=UPI0026E1261F|nr:YdbH domain-containing protein [Agarivorans sp. 1_MG-2023]MDO6764906.1 YdbH domain-containing protein [Agarivorans sp. 1_MG-2023]
MACVFSSVCSANTQLLAAMAQGEWGGCPAVHTEGLSITAIPLSVSIESVHLDVSCLLDTEPDASSETISPPMLQAASQQMFDQLLALPQALSASQVEVKNLQLSAHQQLITQGKLGLKQQGQQWQLNYQEQGPNSTSQFSLLILPKSSHISLSGMLGNTLLARLATFSQQRWLVDSRLHNLDFSLSGLVGQELKLKGALNLPEIDASFTAKLSQWNNWHLRLASSPLSIADINLPAANWQLTNDSWRVSVDDWQAEGSGSWQLSPELAVKGRLSSENLLPLQQAFIDLPEPANLLSAAATVDFTWQSQQLTGSIDATTINALWGELRFDDASITSAFSYQPQQGWQHQGKLSLAQWDIGIPLSELALHWQQPMFSPITQWQSLLLQDISFNVLGGQAQLEEVPLALPNTALLQIEKIQLEQLVKLYPELGLSMHGSVSGRLPMRFGEQGIAITDGELAVVEPSGHISLTHQSLVAVKAQHASLDFALSLLEDFDYETLAAEVDFAEDGQLDMQVKLIGRNQQVSPRLVTLNYGHQENIYQLLRSLRIGEQLSGQLQQWIDDTSSLAAPSP